MGLFTPAELQSYSKDMVAGGGSFINESGIHEITIKAVVVSRNANNARSLNILYEYKGNPSVLYGLKLDNNLVDKNTGLHTPNFERAIFFRLCEICGVKPENIDEVSVTTDTEPYFNYAKQVAATGKPKPENINVLQEFEDKEVKVCLQREWSLYNGQIKKKFVVKDFYRADDNAHASEIVDTNIKAGTRYEKDLKMFSGKDKYNDGLTAEDVSSGSSTQANTASNAPQAANPFK